MPYPDKPAYPYDYVGYQASEPTLPLPAQQVAADFAHTKSAIDQIVDFIKVSIRSDNKVQPKMVPASALAPDAVALIGGWNPRGIWTAATSYAVKDVISVGTFTYVCVTAHTSGTFSTDLAAGKWMFLSFDQPSSYSVELLSDMKALPVRPAIVIVNGKVAPNDGWGGEFYWADGDSSTADDTDVVAPTDGPAGRYKRLNVSVKGGLALLADLKGMLARPQIIVVSGKNAPNDGWGGTFYWDAGSSTTPDDALVVQPTNGPAGRYKRMHDRRIDPRWWGFSGGDETAAYNGATSAIQALGGGVLVVPAFAHTVNGPVVYTGNNISVQGGGPAVSQIFKTSTTGDVFAFTGDKYNFTGFIVECVGTHTGGKIFALATSGGNVSLTEVWTFQGYDVLALGSGAQLYIDNCTFNQFRRHGIRPGPAWGGLTEINNVNMNCDESNQGSALYLESGDTFHVSNVNCAGQLQPLVFMPQVNGTLVNVFCSNVFGDGIGRTATGFDGWLIAGTAAECTLGRIFLVNCWAGVNRRHGVFIVGSVDVVQMTNCYFITNLGHGVFLTAAPTNVTLDGCMISGNSLLTPGTYDGVLVDNFTAEFVIRNSRIGPTALITTDNHGYSVNIDGANHDHYHVMDNDLRGGATATMRDQGTGSDKTIRNNSGYKTANKITSKIDAGTNTKVISHGLAVTPTLADIAITWGSNGGGAYGRYWISAITDTSLNVNVETNVVSDLNFGCDVRCFQ